MSESEIYVILNPGVDACGEFSGAFQIGTNRVYIEKVYYNNPATIVFWSDGTKTISKCHNGDTYNPEQGLLLCVFKKISKNRIMNLFDDWTPRESNIVTLRDVRQRHKND